MTHSVKLHINGGLLTPDTVVAEKTLTLRWGLCGEKGQQAYSVALLYRGVPLYQSGWVKTKDQHCTFTAPTLRSGFEYEVSLSLRDDAGEETVSKGNFFRTARLEEWTAPWITAPRDFGDAVLYFEREIELTENEIENAVLYLCGIGYHAATINGASVSDHRLAPSVSDYSKRCYYETLNVAPLLRRGSNRLCVAVAQGWRRNEGEYLVHLKNRAVPFFGKPMLTAHLCVTDLNGSTAEWVTDERWSCRTGPITCSHLFNGETYNASAAFSPAQHCIIQKHSAPLCPDLLEPIRLKKIHRPVSLHKVSDGYVFDLGKNIAGVTELTLPPLPAGSKITLQHAEVLNEDGDLYTAPLRGAKATDTYIYGTDNPTVWSPSFTYHGFRYVKVKGLTQRPTRDLLRGLQFYTDIDNQSNFRCGSALVNQLQEMVLATERDNIHSIATDCPQRDERMGWLNDATVRFTEMPYNFEIGRLFPKLLQDICDTAQEGAISCTAPFLFGNRPADPVSSSFLVAAHMAWLHKGDLEPIRKNYRAMCDWNEYLASISENGIVSLSHYGDWASPKDCCQGSARSALTPGEFMSTGYHYYNSKLLARFAALLDHQEEAAYHRARAERIREAMLKKWLTSDGTVCTGSQGCQAFALWLGILPKEIQPLAAAKMDQAVKKAGMRLTTGNLCTLYLLEMLTEHGYIDTAWALITREEYPSWGYMMQNGATTVWERFELKKDPGMNSHCHPMYGSVGKWLYSHIAGITPRTAGYETVRIRPYLPKALLSAQATVDTCRGEITVQWKKAYGETVLLVDLPQGVLGTVEFGGQNHKVGGGTHVYRLQNKKYNLKEKVL